MLEWARPAAAVVDTRHPAADSDRFLAASSDLEVELVVFGPADVTPRDARRRRRRAIATVPTADPELIGGAFDAAVGRG